MESVDQEGRTYSLLIPVRFIAGKLQQFASFLFIQVICQEDFPKQILLGLFLSVLKCRQIGNADGKFSGHVIEQFISVNPDLTKLSSEACQHAGSSAEVWTLPLVSLFSIRFILS